MEKIRYDPPRPRLSAESARRAAEKFADIYAHSWLICGASQRPDRIVDDLADAVVRLDSTIPDGYRLALELDKLPHWHLYFDDVETLHYMRLFVCEEVEQAQRIWAQENDIRPPYPLGQPEKIRNDSRLVRARRCQLSGGSRRRTSAGIFNQRRIRTNRADPLNPNQRTK